MRKFFFTAVLVLCTMLSYAQTTQWIGPNGGEWATASNWSNGIPGSGNNALITSGSNVVINAPLIFDFTVTSFSGNIDINADVFNNGTFTNSGGEISIAEGVTVVNSGSKSFTNDGPFSNSGIFQNYGILSQNGNGVFTNNASGSFSNVGNFTNVGNFINNGKVENAGALTNAATFTNNAVTKNGGQFINTFVSTVNNNEGAIFTNNEDAQLFIDKTFNNDGTFTDNGSTTVNAAGLITNRGTMNLDGNFELSTTLNNNETVNVNGTYKSNFGITRNNGQWINKGRTENVGTFNNLLGSTLTNTGVLINASCATFVQRARITIDDITNDGVFYKLRGSINETEASQGRVLTNINVKPTPTLECRDIRIQTDGDGNAVISDGDVLIDGDAKYCNLVTIEVSKTDFTCSDLGANPVTLTLTDGFGNSNSCDVTVTVVERSPNPCNTSILDYCSSSIEVANSSEYIRHVTIGDTRHSSFRDGGYRDFTNKIFTLEFGEFYDLDVVRWGGRLEDRIGVWIDWNNDGDFTDDGEEIMDENTSTSNPATVGAVINLPSTAVPGRTRMRVGMKRVGSGGTFGPCGTYGFGEIEDFTIKIVSDIIIQDCGEDVEVDAAPGATSQTVGWIPPKGFSTCENGVDIEQIDGLTNGSAFPVGTTVNTFSFKDGCENEVTCSFEVKVNSTPVTFSLNCPAPLTIIGNDDLGGAVVNWELPFPSATCPNGVNLPVQTSGPNQGDFRAFDPRPILVGYEASDNCGNTANCVFSITVVAPPQATIYQHCGYRGFRASLGVGRYPNINNISGTSLGINQLSSLRVPPGLQVTLFVGQNFIGNSTTFTEDDICLINNSFNDVATSLIIEPLSVVGVRSSISQLQVSPVFGQKTKLRWDFTQKEDKKVKQYVIMHSTHEEEKMTDIATISAEDAVGNVVYDHMHELPSVGINYYQVLVEFEDGTTNYQMVGEVSFKENKAGLLVAPNPASDFLKVDLSKYMDKAITYSISNSRGEVMIAGEQDANHSGTVEVGLENFQNGIYIIRVSPEGRRPVATRFIVAKDY